MINKKYIIILVIGFLLGIGFCGLSYVAYKKTKPFLVKVKQKLKERRIANYPKEKKSLLLSDFESNSDLNKWETYKADIELVKENTISGKQSAKITYHPESGAATVKIEDYFSTNRKITNWAGYEVIVFDIFNPSPERERIILQIKDSSENRFKKNLYLEPNKINRCVVDVIDLWDDIDPTKIGQFNLFLWNNHSDKAFYLDNLRLISLNEIMKEKKNITAKEFTPKSSEKIYATGDYFAFDKEAWLKETSEGNEIIQAPLEIDNFTADDLVEMPFRGGVPFAKGQIKSLERVIVVDEEGNIIPHQSKILAFWPDKSIKWALITLKASVPSGKTKNLYLQYGDTIRPLKQPSALKIEEAPQEITVTTGPLKFNIDKNSFYLFNKVWRDMNQDKEFDDNEIVTKKADLVLTHNGKEYHSYLDRNVTFTIEEKGPEAVCIKAQGWFTSERNEKFCQFITRIYAYPGSDYLKVKHTFVYTGYPENKYHYLYKGKRLPENETIEEVYIKLPFETKPEDVFTYSVNNEFLRSDIKGSLFLTQTQDDKFSFNQGGLPLDKEGRIGDWIDVSDYSRGISIGVKNLWQQYPKGFRVNNKDKSIVTYLWPKEAGQLDLKTIESADGPDACARGSAFGLAKTHDIVFYFHNTGISRQAVATMEGLCSDIVLRASKEWVSDTKALGRVLESGSTLFLFKDAEKFLSDLFDWGARQIKNFKWYGMIDFGDTLSWYRKEAYDESYDEWGWHPRGRWGWFNCEGVGTHTGSLIQFLRTGEYKYFTFGANLARHIMDIDTCHYNTVANDKRLSRVITDDYSQVGSMHRHNANHWGGRNEETSHTNIAGLALYYYITGDERAHDVINEVGSFLLKEKITYFGHPDIAPQRNIANVLWGDVVLYEITTDERYKEEADKWANLLYSGQGYDGTWSEQYNPVKERWEGKPNMSFAKGYTIPALIEYHKLTGNKAIADSIIKAADFIMDNDEYGVYFPATAYSYWLTKDKKYLENIKNRVKFAINHQRRNDDPLWNGMIYQKAYYARVMEYLYDVPFAFEVLDNEE